MGARDIKIDYKDYSDRFEVLIISDFDLSKKDMIKTLKKYLGVSRKEAMENYYWELAGNYQDDNVLTLVGMMTDDVEIDTGVDKVSIRLLRRKSQFKH